MTGGAATSHPFFFGFRPTRQSPGKHAVGQRLRESAAGGKFNGQHKAVTNNKDIQRHE